MKQVPLLERGPEDEVGWEHLQVHRGLRPLVMTIDDGGASFLTTYPFGYLPPLNMLYF